MTNKLRKRYPSRWCILAACLMFLCLTGIQYAFGLISDAIKDRLHLTQTQVDTIGVLGTIGANSGIIAGLFNNRYHPNVSIWVGVIITTIGYALLTAITTQFYKTQSFILTCFANFLFNHGTAWFSMIANPAIAQNFPVKDQGKLLGLGKSYLGIGSAFISVFKTDLANDQINRFMVYTMIFIPIMGSIFGWFVLILPHNLATNYLQNEIKYGKQKQCGLSILLWYLCAFVFAIYLVFIAILQTQYTYNIYIQYLLFVITIILFISPWILAIFCHNNVTINYDDAEQQIKQLKINESESKTKLLQDNICNTDDIGMPQIFTYWQLYFLYIINGTVAGTATSFISNISQIIESAASSAVVDNPNNNIATALVAIVSFGSFIGRILGGICCDFFSNRLHVSFWLIIPPLLMTISQLLLFFSGTNILLICICGFCIGISIGFVFSTAIINVTDLWGTKYLSGNYSIFDSAAAIGGTIFSTFIFGRIYDQYAHYQKHKIHYSGTKCYGDNCYKWTALICSCSAFFALLLAIILWRFGKNKKSARKKK